MDIVFNGLVILRWGNDLNRTDGCGGDSRRSQNPNRQAGPRFPRRSVPRHRGVPLGWQPGEWHDPCGHKFFRRRHGRAGKADKGSDFRSIRRRMATAEAGVHRFGGTAATGIRSRACPRGRQTQIRKSQHRGGEETGDRCKNPFHQNQITKRCTKCKGRLGLPVKPMVGKSSPSRMSVYWLSNARMEAETPRFLRDGATDRGTCSPQSKATVEHRHGTVGETI